MESYHNDSILYSYCPFFSPPSGIYAESYRNAQWLYIGAVPGNSSDMLDAEDSESATSNLDTSLGDADVIGEDGGATEPSAREGLTVSVDSGLGQSESSPRLYKQRGE